MSNEQNTNQNNQPGQGGVFANPLHSVRQQIENQIGQQIDHYASHVPGGSNFTPEAKQAVSGILDNLQKQLEAEAANRLGGLAGNLGGLGGNAGGTGSANQRGVQGGNSLL